MKISDEKMVSLTYDLTVEGELMEKTTKERPLTFLFGMGMMLEMFEKNIEGLQVGDKFSFTLSPEEAYGERNEDIVVELPKKVFEVDGKFDDEMVFEGATLPMMNANGQRIMGSILEIKSDIVVMDFNHPLAGETLHFEGEVIDVHEPTVEEIAAITDGSCDCGSCDSKDNENGCNCGCQ